MRPLTALLIQHSANSDNLGVGALTASQIAILRDAAQTAGRTLKFVIAGWRDPRAPYITGEDIEIREVSRETILSRSGVWQMMRQADLVLDIGGGDSFADIYGAKRLALNLVLKEMALRSRTPLIISPQTMGPFEATWAKWGARRAVRKAHTVCTRDALSTRYLRDIGYDGAVIEATDVAMRLPHTPPPHTPPPHTPPPHTPPPARQGEGPVRVGLGVSGLLMNGGYTGGNMFGLSADYPALMRDLLQALGTRNDLAVELVGHVISDAQPIEDDHRAAEALAAEFPGVGVAPRFASPSEAKSHIAGLDFFAGARMHACIAAFSTGVAVVPMAYSRKFAGLFGTLGYDHTLDLKTLDAEAVKIGVLNGIDARTALAADARTGYVRALERLAPYETALADLLKTL